jgi:hypothetical protein
LYIKVRYESIIFVCMSKIIMYEVLDVQHLTFQEPHSDAAHNHTNTLK